MTPPFRWWCLPSWLGLDAPCVVSSWTWAISRSTALPPSLHPAIAMFLVVWSIYLSDRLIDVAQCRDWEKATGRLRFGRRFRPLFVICLAFCVAGIGGVVWLGLPQDVYWRAALVAGGVATHFLLFVVPVVFRKKLPGKEFGVGLFFALGAFACIGARASDIAFFAAVALAVAFNCLVIAARDADSDEANDPGGASRWWKTMRRDLLWVGTALTITFGLCALLSKEKSFFLAIALAFAALTLLHNYGQQFSGDAVRALADFALLTPLPVMGAFALAHGKPYDLQSHVNPRADSRTTSWLAGEKIGADHMQSTRPFDIAMCMYYTGIDPLTNDAVYVARALRDRRLQRALLQFFRPENYFEVRKALEKAGRTDLIGAGCDALIPAQPPREALEALRAKANRALRGDHVHTVPQPAKKTGYRPGRKMRGERRGARGERGA